VEKKNRPIHQKVHSEKTIRVTVTMQAPRLVTERLKNAASIALLEKIGMRKEAHFKQSVWIDGRWEDDVIYAVLNDEWKY
jgi:hypothetical protein